MVPYRIYLTYTSFSTIVCHPRANGDPVLDSRACLLVYIPLGMQADVHIRVNKITIYPKPLFLQSLTSFLPLALLHLPLKQMSYT